MMTRVNVSEQVEAFVKSLAPEPRRALRQAIKALASDKGDRKRLEGKLAAYHRLRVGGYRVIYAERFVSGRRVIECLLARERAIVYELFLQLRAEEFGA
jgi:mRNA-degrading endonuclease RelE of RelBE toxin-antitoxin system